ncbi:MAG: hypothetical protein OET44_03620 [Gammaproteobacteria bacterium]|nr:hypothetical protein [Gammaproteobacteria bacterium]
MQKIRTDKALALATCLVLVSTAGAHPMTEKYIPVGAYPNWDRGTVRGTLESVDQAEKSIVVRTSKGLERAILGETTKIWLDRSSMRKVNLDGSLSDLRAGQEIEVRRDGEYGLWIKMKVAP